MMTAAAATATATATSTATAQQQQQQARFIMVIDQDEFGIDPATKKIVKRVNGIY